MSNPRKRPRAGSKEYDLGLSSLLRAPPGRNVKQSHSPSRRLSDPNRSKHDDSGAAVVGQASPPSNVSDSRRLREGKNEGGDSDVDTACQSLLHRAELLCPKTGESVFVLRSLGSEGVAVAGAAEVTVLRGAVDVLGFCLTVRTGPVLISSAPVGPFIVALRARQNPLPDATDVTDAPGFRISDNVKSTLANFVPVSGGGGNEFCALVHIKPLAAEQNMAIKLLSYPSLSLPSNGLGGIVGSFRMDVPNCLVQGFVRPEAVSKLPRCRLWDAWSSVCKCLEAASTEDPGVLRVLVCGDHGSGKSMLARHVVNFLLSECGHDVVLFVDTDVGQPELTPPGLIAAVEVRSALVGPPASHNRSVPVYASYFGEITAREHVGLYRDSVRNVLAAARAYAKEHNMAIVCNSDGWVSGCGGELLGDLAQHLAPSHAFATTYAKSSKDQDHKGGKQVKKLKASLPDAVQAILKNLRSLHAVVLASPFESRQSVYAAPVLRDVGIVCYFDEVLLSGHVWRVDLEDVCISFVSEGVPPQHLLASLNGSLVAVAETDGKSSAQLWNVRGLAIVRAVDTSALHIVTCIPSEILEGCDGILMSAGIQVPTAIFMKSARSGVVSGRKSRTDDLPVPYVVDKMVACSEPMRSRSTLSRRQ